MISFWIQDTRSESFVTVGNHFPKRQRSLKINCIGINIRESFPFVFLLNFSLTLQLTEHVHSPERVQSI